jgi:hypothetical protein
MWLSFLGLCRIDKKRYPIHLGVCDVPTTCKLFLNQDYVSSSCLSQYRCPHTLKLWSMGSSLLHQYLAKQQNFEMVSWMCNGTEMLRSHKLAALSKWQLVPNLTSLQVEDKHARSSKDDGGWSWIWDLNFISVLYSHLAKPSWDDNHFFYIFLCTTTTLATNKNS